MELRHKKRLMELKKLYAYDWAKACADDPGLKDETELEQLKFLSYYDINMKMCNTINDFYDNSDFFEGHELTNLIATTLARYLGDCVERDDNEPDFKKFLRKKVLMFYKGEHADE